MFDPELTTAERLRLFGTDQPLAPVRHLMAGLLSADLIEGNLRSIRYAGIEIIRGMSYLVRSSNWGTYEPVISNLVVESTTEGTVVRYDAHIGEPRDAAGLRFSANLELHKSGRLLFTVEAVPDTDFQTNRCGFCILHPIVGVAGASARIEHVDGTIELSRFPELIDPKQPFDAMRAITHWIDPAVSIECRMDGDSFEMEDQRNWTDASFKTYVRPLALPWPYTLPKGQLNRQVITLTVTDQREQKAAVAIGDTSEPTTITMGDVSGTMPKFGLAIAPDQVEATLGQAERLLDLAPQVLLFHFDPTMGHGIEELRGFQQIASLLPKSEVCMECVVPCAEAPSVELARFAAQVLQAGLVLGSIVVSPAVDRKSTPPGSVWPPCPPLAEVYAATRIAFPGVRLGGGMLSYFTELNRKRPPVELLDFVSHCTSPIVHAADDLSVMQTLEALPSVASSARAIIGVDKPYLIGPSTIGMRHNPYGNAVLTNPHRQRLPMAESDPRQVGQFAAAFMIGYAAGTANADLEVLTLSALTGPFGLLNADGTPRPAFAAAQSLSARGTHPRVAVQASAPQTVAAVATQSKLVVANLTARSQRVQIADVSFQLGAFDIIERPIVG